MAIARKRNTAESPQVVGAAGERAIDHSVPRVGPGCGAEWPELPPRWSRHPFKDLKLQIREEANRLWDMHPGDFIDDDEALNLANGKMLVSPNRAAVDLIRAAIKDPDWNPHLADTPDRWQVVADVLVKVYRVDPVTIATMPVTDVLTYLSAEPPQRQLSYEDTDDTGRLVLDVTGRRAKYDGDEYVFRSDASLDIINKLADADGGWVSGGMLKRTSGCRPDKTIKGLRAKPFWIDIIESDTAGYRLAVPVVAVVSGCKTSPS
jgi:hypothetical protein